jgi:hypothetical protein
MPPLLTHLLEVSGLRVTVEDGSGRKVVLDDWPEPAHVTPQKWDGTGVAGQLVKADPAKRYTLCLAYPVNKADQAVAQDGHRDFAGATALEECAWNFLAKSPKVGAYHQDGTEGAGTVVESYLWPAGDWVMKAVDGSEQTIVKGDWLLGVVWGSAIWKAILDGRVRGVSMQGSASRRAPSTEALAALRR